MKTCLFCGNPPHRCGEHIIAQAIYKRMKQERFAICVGKVTDSTKVERRKTQTLNSYVTNHVCEKCNHGWMSALEVWFLKNLGMLIEPTWPELARTLIKQVALDQTNLVRWLLKTAVTAEANSLVRKQIIPDWVHPLAKDTVPAKDFWVDVAYSKNRTVALLLEKGFPMINGNQYLPLQFHKDGFSFTLQLNHLLLRIFHAPQAVPMRLLPVGSPSFASIATRGYLQFENIRDFQRSVLLRTWRGKT